MRKYYFCQQRNFEFGVYRIFVVVMQLITAQQYNNLRTLLSFCGGPGAFGVPAEDAAVPLPLPLFDPNEFDDVNDRDEAFELFELQNRKRNTENKN